MEPGDNLCAIQRRNVAKQIDAEIYLQRAGRHVRWTQMSTRRGLLQRNGECARLSWSLTHRKRFYFVLIWRSFTHSTHLLYSVVVTRKPRSGLCTRQGRHVPPQDTKEPKWSFHFVVVDDVVFSHNGASGADSKTTLCFVALARWWQRERSC